MRKPLAITNYRVSSDEQLKNNSIAKQKKMCLDAIESLGAELHRSWEGSVSSKKGLNIFRKDLQEMLDECKQNRQIKYAVFDELDRFMRSMLEIGHFLVQFQRLGVEVKFASQPTLNTKTATDTLLLMLEAYKAEGSNEERQRKSINGQTNALKEGRYTFVPKPGYIKGRQTGIHEIDPIKAPALKQVLLDIAYRRVTPSQGLVELNKSDFMSDGHSLYKMDKFRKIATDAYYAGIVEIHKQIDVRNENGLHEPLISIEEHRALIDIFTNKHKNQKGPRKNGNPIFPISNKVNCKLCGEASNGRFVGLELHNGKNTGKIYQKYRCRACKRYISKEELHKEVEKQFTDRPISSEGRKDVLEALSVVWKREEAQAEQEKAKLQHRIKVTKEQIDSRALAAIDPSNKPIKEEIMARIEKDKQELIRFEKQLFDVDIVAEDDKQEFLEFAYNFIEKMGANFLNTEVVSPENRERCKQIVFPAGFYVDENNKVYTPEISELYRLATKQKDLPATEKSLMVQHS